MRGLGGVSVAVLLVLVLVGTAQAWRPTKVKGLPGGVTVMRVHGARDAQGNLSLWWPASYVTRSIDPNSRSVDQYICAAWIAFTLNNGAWAAAGPKSGPYCAWVAPGRRLRVQPVSRQAGVLSAYRLLEVVTWGVNGPARLLGSEVIDLSDAGDYTCDAGACIVHTKYSSVDGSPVRSWLFFPMQ
jgi:hypothetical protein